MRTLANALRWAAGEAWEKVNVVQTRPGRSPRDSC